ncbi:MAG TPA: Uma2 family endonuclease [Thermoanaerobaculia bacterium]|nr:Uma2 family endonuclease [Thermoanaerobaculia bacterium]
MRRLRATPEDRRYEVIDGELFMTPAPTPFHQIVSIRLTRLLTDFTQERGLGTVLQAPCDVVLSPHDILQPDIFFVSAARRAIIGDRYVGPAPELVIEVLSPSTETRDRIAKAKRYATFGVGEMWLVDPAAQTIEVLVSTADGFRQHLLAEGSGLVRSTVLPGLKFPASLIFRPL